MNILLCNYRYFVSGGPERYLFNVKKLLELNEHKVIPFSISNASNEPNEYDKFFVSSVGDDQVYFNANDGGGAEKWKVIERLFFSFETRTKVITLLEQEPIEIAYILHYLRKLSPSLLSALRKKKIPIVVRLSDYGMLCPENHFYKNDSICTQCIDKNLTKSITGKCVKGNLALSAVNYVATYIHKMSNIFSYIDKFVCTNYFMYEMMIKAGYSEDRLCVIPTFSDEDVFKPLEKTEEMENFKKITFSGRLVQNKGVHVLIDAINFLVNNKGIDCHLDIMGSGEEHYVNKLKSRVKKYGLDNNITFFGKTDVITVAKKLSESSVSVVPSLWFENLPNALIESLYCGTPVICPNHGSFIGLINDRENGLYYESDNYVDLADKLYEFFTVNSCYVREKIAANAREKFGAQSHYNKLSSLFSELKSR